MKDKYNTEKFIADLVQEIERRDSLHIKKIEKNLKTIFKDNKEDFYELANLIYLYFIKISIPTSEIAVAYLKMIKDMRIEGLYFKKNNKYSCENQLAAYNNVYSKKDTMSYYMNALLVSQILWKHHFNMFVFFKNNLLNYFLYESKVRILDVGPGHGFFSYIIKKNIPDYTCIDIVDISESSLNFTKQIVGEEQDRINYYNDDIFIFKSNKKYDLIVIGEVIEHLDKPLELLRKLSDLLEDNGIVWITTPTNAPALDHVYLFRSKEDVFELINNSNLEIDRTYYEYAEDIEEALAIKNKITCLIGVFARKEKNEIQRN